MHTDHRLIMDTRRALCGLASGLLLLAAGAAQSHAGLIDLANSDFDSAPGGWSSNHYEVSADAGQIVPNSGADVLNLVNFVGSSQAAPNFLLQNTTHRITAGELYTLTFYAGLRTDIAALGGAINAVASLRAQGWGSDLASLTVLGSQTPVGSMQEYTLAWQAPDSGAFLGQDLEVHFQSATSSPDSQSWHQISLDTVALGFTPVPEPATALVGVALLGLCIVRRRRA